jgi:hypothetical protein
MTAKYVCQWHAKKLYQIELYKSISTITCITLLRNPLPNLPDYIYNFSPGKNTVVQGKDIGK